MPSALGISIVRQMLKIGIQFGIRFLTVKYVKICAFLIALSVLKE